MKPLFDEWERIHLSGDEYQLRVLVTGVPALAGTALDAPDKCVMVSFVGTREHHSHLILPWSIDEDSSITLLKYRALLTHEVQAAILESLPPIPWPEPASETRKP